MRPPRQKKGDNGVRALGALYQGMAILLAVIGHSSGAVAAPPPAVAPPAAAEMQNANNKPPPVFTYKRAGRRDPFKPLIQRAGKPPPGTHRPPLERYNINDFKLTAIMWGGFGYNAMVEGPDGKGYFVRVGTVIGPNRGVVKKIMRHQMVIEEKYKTYTGKTERKRIVVKLKKK